MLLNCLSFTSHRNHTIEKADVMANILNVLFGSVVLMFCVVWINAAHGMCYHVDSIHMHVHGKLAS